MEVKKTNSGLYIPYSDDQRYKDQQELYREAWEFYDKKHQVCPECGKEDLYLTLMGNMGFPADPSFKDTNTATCDCGWVGTRHDML